jgi:hypothetical protein
MNYKNVPEVNDFWCSKIKFYFNDILDVNSDGVINSLDIEFFRNLYSQMKHLAIDSPELAQFSGFLQTWFRTMKDSGESSNSDVTLDVNHVNSLFLFQ